MVGLLQKTKILIDGGAMFMHGDAANRLFMSLIEQSITPTAGLFQEYETLKNQDKTYLQPHDGLTLAVTNLTGPIVDNSGISYLGANEITRNMRDADNNPDVSAHVIYSNSPGGAVTASQQLYNGVRDLTKPVVTYAQQMVSGSLMATLSSDLIVGAGDTAEGGSIGVQVVVDKWMLDMYKMYFETVRASTSPDKNAEFDALMNGDKGPLVKKLDKLDTAFMSLVLKNRPLSGSPSVVEKTLSGGTWFGKEAKQRGLFDTLGTMSDALDAAAEMVRNKTKRKKK